MVTEENSKSKKYNPEEVEKKWQNIWKKDDIYKTPDKVDSKQNWYALSMFPYPSGDLHIGHWFAFAPADAHARFKRLSGYNVMHPQGFDAFGLPAENAAIQRNINPKKWTFDNIQNMQKQFEMMGNSYDWNRKLVTCTPEYYKWNQKFFIDMYKNGLAYRKNGPVWWDPIDQTTLANEQVVDGKSERSGAEVEKKMMPQWYFKITDYAEELLNMNDLEWPEKIKQMQKNWIGKSEGVTINFDIENSTEKISTFTTRIDTVFGVTFVVLAPEHPIIKKLNIDKNKDVSEYISNSQKLSEIDRTSTV
ncbi:MAG: class I tRNA ligase family protein, partial [Chloroflexota bacterium]|nr:class I tRNA ligase family protein [Chloroflexota bacterium]